MFRLFRTLLACLCCLTPLLAVAADPGTSALYDAKLPDLRARAQSLQQWRGKILVVNFWASWCGPCVREMPALSSLNDRYRAKKVQFVGIAVDTKTNVNQFLKKVTIDYPILIAGFEGTDLAEKLGDKLKGLPFTVIIDADGDVAYRKLGEIDPSVIAGELDRLTKSAR